VPSVYTISGASQNAHAFQISTLTGAEDEIDRVKRQSWYIAGGSAVIGILIGVFVGIAVKGS